MNTHARLKNNTLEFLKPHEVNKYLSKYKDDQRFDIEVSLPEEKMSDRQRKYYFSILQFASEHLRADYRLLHEFFKNLFLMELQEINGKVFPTFPKGKIFRKLSTKNMKIYVDNVRMELRSPDNLWETSLDTESPEEFYTRMSEGIL